jgi:hypothetical protein
MPNEASKTNWRGQAAIVAEHKQRHESFICKRLLTQFNCLVSGHRRAGAPGYPGGMAALSNQDLRLGIERLDVQRLPPGDKNC